MELRDRFGVQADILPTEIDGERRYRLVSPAMAEPAARRLIEDLAARGISSWFLRHERRVPPAMAEPEPPAREPVTVSADAVAATPEPPDAAAETEAVTAPFDPATDAPGLPSRPDAPPASRTVDASSAAPQTGTADPETGFPVHVPYYEAADIVIDGRVDESVWRDVPGYDDMRVIDPDTMAEPGYRTLYRFLYTAKGLYVGAFMEQPPDSFVSRLSSRDRYLNRDSFGISLDTSGEGLYGYWFTVTLGGSLMDGKVVPERTITEQWDGPWLGASAARDDGWSAETFLPWSMMSMPASNGADGVPGPRKLTFWVDR